MSDRACELGGTFNRELTDIICGALLGSGVARYVYAYIPNPKWVVKIEPDAGSFQNIMEWEVWHSVEHTKWAKWFAPCHYISPNGSVMIQSRTKPLADKPKSLPNFLTDLKAENFGRIGKQVVTHDYGLNMLIERGLGSARMVKPRNWYS